MNPARACPQLGVQPPPEQQAGSAELSMPPHQSLLCATAALAQPQGCWADREREQEQEQERCHSALLETSKTICR